MQCIPETHSGRRRLLPGWNLIVRPFRDKSLLWHRIWVDAGRPGRGVLASIHRTCQGAYREALRNAKYIDLLLRSISASCVYGSDRFWHFIKKINPSSGNSACVENKVDSREIADAFAKEYHSLYNAHAESLRNFSVFNFDYNCIKK
jgi:hypothetical protein